MNKELKNRIYSSIIIAPLTIYLIYKGSFIFIFFILLCYFISLYEWSLMSKKKRYFFPGIIFLTFSFINVYLLRYNFSNEISLYLFFFVVIICIFTDIGGYLFGKVFKGPKLTKISPNKTIAGVIGSYLLPILFINFFFDNFLLNIFLKNTYNFKMNIFILIILVSTVSQIGDLIISYFKRISKINDTGKIIPGHGGILDRIDGMIFAIPFFYLIVRFF
ncbi:phosphatidate cytidylyltransferase [Candidatus Pelagibacter bacterium]|nr:phosphatidate cytidylyltransferase [Candidatus Pelagibacter bacterium]